MIWFKELVIKRRVWKRKRRTSITSENPGEPIAFCLEEGGQVLGETRIDRTYGFAGSTFGFSSSFLKIVAHTVKCEFRRRNILFSRLAFTT